jgi:hypothetical protein
MLLYYLCYTYHLLPQPIRRLSTDIPPRVELLQTAVLVRECQGGEREIGMERVWVVVGFFAKTSQG